MELLMVCCTSDAKLITEFLLQETKLFSIQSSSLLVARLTLAIVFLSICMYTYSYIAMYSQFLLFTYTTHSIIIIRSYIV